MSAPIPRRISLLDHYEPIDCERLPPIAALRIEAIKQPPAPRERLHAGNAMCMACGNGHTPTGARAAYCQVLDDYFPARVVRVCASFTIKRRS